MRLPVLLVLLFSLPVYGQTFTVGVVPQFDIKTLHAIWKPVLTELEARTGHTFTLEGAIDIPAFETALQQGRYDFAYMNPYHYTKARQYTPIIRDHKRMLYGVLVVAKDSDIQRPEDLQGRTLAFPAPNALGASLLMRAELKRRYGLNFTPKYVKTHSSVYLNVAVGLAAAGGGVQKTLNQQPQQVRQRLRILHTTQRVPPHPLTAHKRLPEDVRRSVQSAFIDMTQQGESQALLEKIPIKLAGPAHDADYQVIRDMQLESFYVQPGP